MSNKTFFGFKEIDTGEKTKQVHNVFSSVASNYDIMNDLMSLGIHRLWKKRFISMLNPSSNSLLIDMAGGTGDITIEFLKKSPDSKVLLCDINYNMLREGEKHLIDKGIISGVDFVCANAEKLPINEHKADYYTIAFGIRNVTHIDEALKEAYRVLKYGGRFMCLEFSMPENSLISKLYDLYSFNIIPKIGKLVAGDESSYQYLVESIRKFPSKEDFASMIREAGFDNVTYTGLNNGIVAIHSGWKL